MPIFELSYAGWSELEDQNYLYHKNKKMSDYKDDVIKLVKEHKLQNNELIHNGRRYCNFDSLNRYVLKGLKEIGYEVLENNENCICLGQDYTTDYEGVLECIEKS